MWIAYAERIRESVAELREQEHALRGQRGADRVKLRRRLKSRLERNLSGTATVLGYSERQAQRWGRRDHAGGLAALVREGQRGDSGERITPAAWDGLSVEMQAGRIGRLKDPQAYLREL